MKKINPVIVIIAILFHLYSLNAWATHLLNFEKESYQKILDNNKGKPFLLVLWSVDCPPCHEELAYLGQYLKGKTDLKTILLSTDSSVDHNEIVNLLKKNNLHEQENWIFSNVPENQLRYSIDQSWYGELPRNYIFNQCHQRQALSGKLNLNNIDDLLSNNQCN